MDNHLRDSERELLISGDGAAEAAWLRTRLREGSLELRLLQAAAQLGYPPALAALDYEVGPPLGAGDDLELLTRVTLAEAREVLEWGATEDERELLAVVDAVEGSLLHGAELIYTRNVAALQLAHLSLFQPEPDGSRFRAYRDELWPLLYTAQESEPRERPLALAAIRTTLARVQEVAPDYPPTANLPGPRRELARCLLGCAPQTRPAAEAPFVAALERYQRSPRDGFLDLVAAGHADGWSFAGRTWSQWFQLLDSPQGGRAAGATLALERAALEEPSISAIVAALAAARLSTPLRDSSRRARVATLQLAHQCRPLPPQLGPALAPYLAQEDKDLQVSTIDLLRQLDDEAHDLHLPIAQVLARALYEPDLHLSEVAIQLLGRSERGVAALNELEERRRPELEFTRALCALCATGDDQALSRLRAAFTDTEFSEGRSSWLFSSAFEALRARPEALLESTPELVSMIERHCHVWPATRLLVTLGDQLQPWLARLRAALEAWQQEELRADLLDLLEQVSAS